MARYCKSCGSISKTQIPLFIAFNAVFLERSVFLSFCIAQTYIYIYIYRQTQPITLPRCAHARRGVIRPGGASPKLGRLDRFHCTC